MKNICFVCFDFSVIGGVERVTCNVANALADKFNVHVLSLRGGESIYRFDDKIKFHSFNLDFTRIRQGILPAAKALRRYYKENKIHISFLQGSGISFICSFTSLFCKTHQVHCDHLSSESGFSNHLLRKGASFLNDYTFILTHAAYEDYIKMFKIPKKKLFIMYNWVDSIYGGEYNADSKLIVSAGRFAEQKEFSTLLPKIAAKVKKRHPDWQWHVFGDGELFEEAKEKVKELNIEDFLILKGRTDKLPELYKDYSFFVMTSNREGLPLVLLDAKAYKLPNVAFDIKTGPSEIIRDGIDGFLIEYPDTDAMADRICTLIEDEDLRKKMSDATKDDIGRFSKETILQQWIDFIESH